MQALFVMTDSLLDLCVPMGAVLLPLGYELCLL